MNLNQFHILKEYDDSYDVGHPGGKKLKIHKNKLSDKAISLIKKMPKYFDGTENGPVSSQDAQDDQVMSPMGADQAARLDSENAAKDLPQSSGDLQPAINNQAPAVPSPGVDVGPASYEQAMQNQKQALVDIGQAQAEQASQESKAIGNMPQYKSQMEIYNEHKNQLNGLEQAYAKQAIDPDRFINTHFKGIGSKIVAGLGAFLGGLGSSVTGGQNPFLSMLKYNIDNDIASQRSNQSQAGNLFQMNRQMMGDDLSANLAAQNQAYMAVKYKMLKAASDMNSKTAMLRAKQGVNAINAQMDQNSALMGFVGGAPGSEDQYAKQLSAMQVYHPEIAKEAQSKYLPGIGVAKVPVEKDDRTELASLDNLDKGLDEAIAAQQSFGKGGAWTTDNRADAKRIQDNLSSNLNALYSLKRINDIQNNKYEDAVKNIGGINMGGQETILKGMKQELAEKKKTILDSLGIKPFNKAPVDQVAIQWARANPKDPQSAKILQINGMK